MAARSQYSKLKQSPRDWRVLRFIRRTPVPEKLVGETEDGDTVNVAVAAEGSHRFADATAAIRNCVQIQAFDGRGNVLRSVELDPEDPELKAADELELARKGTPGAPGSVSLISIDVPKLVDNIAGNMQRVAESAASQQATAFREGFQAMVSVVNLCLSLLVRTEERLQLEQEKERDDEGATPSREQLAMLALQQAMNGAPKPTNGAATMDPAMLAQLGALFQHLQNGASSGDAGQ